MLRRIKDATSLGNTKQGGSNMFKTLTQGVKKIGRNSTRDTKVAKKVKDIKREREVAKIIKEYEAKESGINSKEEWAKNKIAKVDKIIDALKKEKSSMEEDLQEVERLTGLTTEESDVLINDAVKSVTPNDETKAKILDDIQQYDWAGIKKAEEVLEEGENKTVEFNDLANMIDLEGRERFSQEFDDIMKDDDVTIVFRETRDSR